MIKSTIMPTSSLNKLSEVLFVLDRATAWGWQQLYMRYQESSSSPEVGIVFKF